MFRHHPDGHIHVGALELRLTEFLIEEPAYALPAGAIGRSYDAVAGRHVLSDGANQWGGPVPWPEGDGYLANEAVYAASTAPPPPTLAETRAAALARVDAEAETARQRFITQGSGQALSYEAKRREVERWAADVAPDPAGYAWARSRAARLNGVAEAAVTVAQAQAVIDEWTARVAGWAIAGIEIEHIREGAKETIVTALDAAAIDAVLAALVWPAPA